jgi:hypothetical protein
MRPLNQSHFYSIKTFVEDFHTKYAKSPTVREVASGTNIPYPTVQYYLNIMKNEGDIEYNGRRSIATPLHIAYYNIVFILLIHNHIEHNQRQPVIDFTLFLSLEICNKPSQRRSTTLFKFLKSSFLKNFSLSSSQIISISKLSKGSLTLTSSKCLRSFYLP